MGDIVKFHLKNKSDDYFEMIIQNKLNQITTGRLIVWTCLRGINCFENDSVEYHCMGDSVQSDCMEKSAVKETVD